MLYKDAIKLHKKLQGKISVSGKAAINSARDLSLLYTPGVGAVSTLLAKHPGLSRDYTIKHNSVAVISDGSAVLGLGNIGPEGALPVLEGKCLIFKKFAGVNAWPIALATQDTEMIISIIKAIAPVFGGINLEDISAPRCFEIERRLERELSIPVMHDDQHGTAVVVLAALVNAAKVVGKKFETLRVVISGAGPAGTATVYILREAGIRHIVVLDSKGIVNARRHDLAPYKQLLAKKTNPQKISGGFEEALRGADVFIGVSRGGLLSRDHIKIMATDSIVFALANPVPEIMPEEARAGGALVVATGRSDYPNQINNALVFPGVFRGALDHNVKRITLKIKIAAAMAIASLVKKPKQNHIIPSIFDKHLVKKVSSTIR